MNLLFFVSGSDLTLLENKVNLVRLVSCPDDNCFNQLYFLCEDAASATRNCEALFRDAKGKKSPFEVVAKWHTHSSIVCMHTPTPP